MGVSQYADKPVAWAFFLIVMTIVAAIIWRFVFPLLDVIVDAITTRMKQWLQAEEIRNQREQLSNETYATLNKTIPGQSEWFKKITSMSVNNAAGIENNGRKIDGLITVMGVDDEVQDYVEQCKHDSVTTEDDDELLGDPDGQSDI